MEEEIKQEPVAEVADNSDKSDGSEKSDGSDVSVVAEAADKPDTSGVDRKIRTYQDWIERLEPLEDEDKRKRRERREKAARVVSAVSDGLRALGNLAFTSRYAPNMYSHERGSQLAAQNAAVERARKEREANRDAHLRLALSLGDAEQERAKTVREFEAERERRRLAREAAQRQAEEHGWKAALQPDVQREQAGKAKTAEQKAATAEAEAENAPGYYKARTEAEVSRGESYRSSARAHDRSNPQVVHHFNGKTYPNGSKDYEKDVREAARKYNERHGRWVERTTQQGKTVMEWEADEGFQRIETDYKVGQYGDLKPRKAEEYAGEVESALAAEREAEAKRSKGAGYGVSKGKGAGY